MNTVTPPGKSSISEILHDGYQGLLESLIPLTKLGLPFFIFGGATSGFIFSDNSIFLHPHRIHSFQELSKLLAGSGLMILISVVMAYVYYIFIRYIRDTYQNAVKSDLYDYLIPQMDLLGLIGLMLISIFLSIPALVVILIGLILLVVPGIIILIYFSTWVMMLYVTYINNSKAGILEGLRENLGLLKGMFWRTVALGFIAGLVKFLIELPFSFILQAVMAIARLHPGAGQTYSLPILFSVLFSATYWAHFVLGTGGFLFVMMRYYWDLRDQHQSPDTPETGLDA